MTAVPKGPAAVQQGDKPQFDFVDPEGREYYCYSDDECMKYMKGYASVLKHRIYMQENHDWYSGVKTHSVPINLWMDYTSSLFLGKLEITKTSKGLFVEMWSEVYDLNGKLIHTAYKGGYGEKNANKTSQ